jgi:4-hydroxy-tetrahydrodipicolinate reductase
MKIVIVGTGKLANAILTSTLILPHTEIVQWDNVHQRLNEKAIIIHAGSGRQLNDCIQYCEATDSVLIELSTGLKTEKLQPNFTLIICPNTSILLLKTLSMLRRFGNYFADYKISITESHQSTKTSAPGTAFSIAQSLRVPKDKVKSIREAETQLNEINIPREYLDKHAYHKIVIEDGLDTITIETKVLGHHSYENGVKKIIDAVLKHPLEKRTYSILELIEKNVL